MALQFSKELALHQIPQANHLVRTAGGDHLSIRAERNCPHLTLVPSQGVQLVASRRIPDDDGLVPARGSQGLPIGTEDDRRHRFAMTWEQLPHELPAGDVPQSDCISPAARRREKRAVRTEGHGPRGTWPLAEQLDPALTTADARELDALVLAG